MRAERMKKCWWHSWVVKDKQILPSMIEQMEECAKMKTSGYGDPSHKPCIVTYVCTKCGVEYVDRV